MTTASPPSAVPVRAAPYYRGVALVLLAGVFLSIGGLGVRLIEAASEWQILFYRSLALVPTLLAVLAWRNRGGLLGAFRRAGVPALIGGLCLSVSFSGFIFSLTHTTVANTLFLLSASPFLAAVLGWLVLGEGVRRATWLAIAAAMVGIGTMVGEGLAVGGLFGDVTALMAALGFAGFTVALRWGKTRDMLPAVCLAALFTAVLAALMTEARAGSFALSARDLGLCVGMGAVQIGVGLTVYTAGSRDLPAAELTLLSLSEVVLGPIWVWLGVGELPSLATVVGGAVLLGAIVGHALSGLRRWRPPIGVA
jgi:drug/metabolite transporter (DMT)-like permease